MIKKIAGILFLTIGFIMTAGILIQLPKLYRDTIDRANEHEQTVAFLIGSVIGFLIPVVLIYFLFKYGLRWVSKKEKVNTSKELMDIGKQ